MEVERLKTGSKPLDDLLNGGVEKGIITNFFGESGTGKTNIAIQIAAQVAKNGEKALYIDSEGGFSPERFNQIASEKHLENLLLKDVTTFEEQNQTILNLPQIVEEENVGVIVVDSMVSLYRLKVDSENANEINQELSNQLATLSKIAREHNIPVIITNQVYTSFDEEKLELVGKDVPRYWSKCLIHVKKREEDTRKLEIEKHRSLPEGKSGFFVIKNQGLLETDKENFY